MQVLSGDLVPIVVCTQTAEEADNVAGWSKAINQSGIFVGCLKNTGAWNFL